ncbi:TlpA disulfide reductase family protein [Danxiaibacter flavus]|uniref:TlpA disulfide reductase family protein n=1 Tax=Danxiaibacter flavus TaxID=3049108 RepID=A0ABV3ZH37_9BACT|nr:TlpA disulfide reductase family protein [Chitinophagaceae bacterium DXS]
MKIFLLFFVFFSSCSILYSQSANTTDSRKSNPSYLINGHLEDSQGKMIYLTEQDFFKDANFKDSAIADARGNFIFSGKVVEPAFCRLEIEGVNSVFEFILENVAIKITGDANKLYASSVNGSRENDIRKIYMAFSTSDSLRAVFENLFKLQAEAEKNKDTAMIAAVGSRLKDANRSTDSVIEALIKKYPFAYSSINSAGGFANSNLEKADSLIRFYEVSEVNHYKQVKYFRKEIDLLKTLSIGAIAPDFIQQDTSFTKTISLSSFRGKYVLLDFWASWCGPCREESSFLVKAQKIFDKEKFAIVSVSCDTDKGKWLQAIRQDQLTWTHLSDLNGWDNQVAKLYAITAIPRNFFLDPEGKIIAKNLRRNEVINKLAEFLK